MMDDSLEPTPPIICPACQSAIVIASTFPKRPIRYCIYCGSSLGMLHSEGHESSHFSHSHSTHSATLVRGHAPEEEPIQFSIGPYQALRNIGKGGMGEVFLAYDTSCGRRIALKRIRSDLIQHEALHNRFLKEARITSQLTHPAIIPIYSIHTEERQIYYTMPYVEGQTLKALLRKARALERKGKRSPYSIPMLIRLFITLCQAIAYAHSKGVLHRDIKPENIIVGTFGEVMLLDWGLAKLLDSPEQEEEIVSNEHPHPLKGLTRAGKVVGTLSYMAPERALGQQATFQTDIYALGVILYQILTLDLPFKRDSLREFRSNLHREELKSPEEVAPYRDVPKILSGITLKCLAKEPETRFQTVEELISELENYVEGRSEWFQTATLDIHDKESWEFQENVLIAEHTAITRNTEEFGWVHLMLSKRSFPGNTKIEVKVKASSLSHGIGFLFCVPEAAEREHPNEGYSLWLGTETHPSTKLLRSTIEVLSAPEVFLKEDTWHVVKIEKIDNNIHCYLDDNLQFSYISHQPLYGSHIGVILKDTHIEAKPLEMYEGGQNVMVNCLAIPDAYLAHKDFTRALSEYRRIGYSFPGRAEGREALFRAGFTLLEQAKSTFAPEQANEYYELALTEFEKLRNTPGAPLEYLGKALTYEALGDPEEEAKCFELAYRRFRNHPLLRILQEQLVYRLHESSRTHRLPTYRFAFLVALYLKDVAAAPQTAKLFQNLRKHWETIPFMEPIEDSELTLQQFSIELAFCLAKPYALEEILDELIAHKVSSCPLIFNALFALVEIGQAPLAKTKLEQLIEHSPSLIEQPDWEVHLKALELVLPESRCFTSLVDPTLNFFDFPMKRSTSLLIKEGLRKGQAASVLETLAQLKEVPMPSELHFKLDLLTIWANLYLQHVKVAGELLSAYPVELASQESSLLFFLFGVWLTLSESKDLGMIHFQGGLDVPYPRSWTLGSHYLAGRLKLEGKWIENAFLWEKRELYFQLALYYAACGAKAEADRALNQAATIYSA